MEGVGRVRAGDGELDLGALAGLGAGLGAHGHHGVVRLVGLHVGDLCGEAGLLHGGLGGVSREAHHFWNHIGLGHGEGDGVRGDKGRALGGVNGHDGAVGSVGVDVGKDHVLGAGVQQRLAGGVLVLPHDLRNHALGGDGYGRPLGGVNALSSGKAAGNHVAKAVVRQLVGGLHVEAGRLERRAGVLLGEADHLRDGSAAPVFLLVGIPGGSAGRAQQDQHQERHGPLGHALLALRQALHRGLYLHGSVRLRQVLWHRRREVRVIQGINAVRGDDVIRVGRVYLRQHDGGQGLQPVRAGREIEARGGSVGELRGVRVRIGDFGGGIGQHGGVWVGGSRRLGEHGGVWVGIRAIGGGVGADQNGLVQVFGTHGGLQGR